MASPDTALPSVFIQHGDPTLILSLRLKSHPGRVTLWRQTVDTCGGRSQTRTAMIFRALARELVRSRLEAGRNPIESKLIAGDEAERAIFELLTEDDKRQLGLTPLVAAQDTNGGNGGANTKTSRKRRGRSPALHL